MFNHSLSSVKEFASTHKEVLARTVVAILFVVLAANPALAAGISLNGFTSKWGTIITTSLYILAAITLIMNLEDLVSGTNATVKALAKIGGWLAAGLWWKDVLALFIG